MNYLNSPRIGGTGNDAILAFYSGEKPDSCGRYIEEVWNFNDHQLENVHDYIQWLFPLQTRSAFNPTAPLLTQRTIRAFRESEPLNSRLRRSIEVMLKFYGLELTEGKHGSMEIGKSPEFSTKSQNWLEPGNHNHLRLTRIMTSARLLGLEHYSRTLFARLEEIMREYPHSFSPRTAEFWREAAGG
jgi:hypothetical protein